LGKRGPKKKPTHLRLLEGNPGRLPINEAEPVSDMPAIKPSIVAADEIASLEWDRVLAAMPPGLYGALDTTMLAAYALAWSMLVKSQVDVAENGLTITTHVTNKVTGEVYVSDVKSNPALRSWKAATETILRCADKLGLHPGARVSLKVPERGAKNTVGGKYAHLMNA